MSAGDDVVIIVELRRAGGPGGEWEATAMADNEDRTELAALTGADAPGTALEELAIELDRLETQAIMALERRAEHRREDTGR